MHLACIRRDLAEMLALCFANARSHLLNLEGKMPHELLSLDFDSACAKLNQTVGGRHFYLNRQEFERAPEQVLLMMQKFLNLKL